MDDFGRCVILTGLSPVSVNLYRALKREIDTAIGHLIEEGMADGSIPPLDTKILAFTLADALNWPARSHDPEGPQSAQAIADQMVALLATGFVPR